MAKEAKCNNCNYKHTGKHPHLCTDCKDKLLDRGVICSPTNVLRSRKAWWVK